MDIAHDHLEQGIACRDRQQPRAPAFLYGHEAHVSGLSYSSWAWWWRGYPEQAVQRSHAALTWAQELSHPFSLAFAHIQAAMIGPFCRAVQAAHEQAAAAVALATEQGFTLWRAVGTILHGWALTTRGHGEQGIGQMRQGLEALRGTGTRLMQPYLLALLAEGYGAVQQPEAGLAVLAAALDVRSQTGECWYDAELYRLKGELLLLQVVGSGSSPPGPSARARWAGARLVSLLGPEAETCLHQALDLARRQQAKALELRAALSLSRWWQYQGKRQAARQLLAESTSWFTEGLETGDLQEARALLEALN